MTAFRLLLIVAATVAFAQINEWRLLDQLIVALVTLLVLTFLWSRASVRRVAAERHATSNRAQVGESISEEISVENRSRFPKLWLEIRDLSTLPGHRGSRVVHLRGNHRISWTVETVCVRRGRYRLGPLIARAGDPFGIFPSARGLEAQHEIVIYPAAVDLPGYVLPAGTLTGGAVTNMRTPFLTPNVSGIREYVQSDAFNRISWSTSARMGRLMVKEFEIDPTADVWVILDLDQRWHLPARMHSGRRDGPPGSWPMEAWLDATEEYAVTITSSLAKRCLTTGRSFGLIATAAHYEILQAERSERQLVRVLESLAVIQADGQRPLAEILGAESRRFSRHTGLIVVTSSLDPAWIGSLEALASKRVRTSAIFVDPESFGGLYPADEIRDRLEQTRIPFQWIRYGDTISSSLTTVRVPSATPVGRYSHE